MNPSINLTSTWRLRHEDPQLSSHRSTTKILLYQTLRSFLKSACSAAATSLGANAASRIQQILDGYLVSMSSENVVGALCNSLEYKKTLLKLSSELGVTNDAGLRRSLRVDEDLVVAYIVSIFDSKAAEQAVLSLKGDSAEGFLDVVQDALDRGFLMQQEHAQKARRIIRKLSKACDRLPASLFIAGVSKREAHPSFGGGFGDVYRAQYKNNIVALKHLRHFLRGDELRTLRLKLCQEALIWKDLQHPNILTFIGIDRETFPSSLCIVSPWMENGTVLSYLGVHGRGNVNKLLFEIAQGIQYLHSRNIVHGDLRGGNILIKPNWAACLADFGLSSFTDVTSRTHTSNRAGSMYWMAPELILPDRFGLKFIRTLATDVYAFGCVCFELYTGRPPFSEFSEPAAMLKIIDGERAQRPEVTPRVSDALWGYVTQYWAGDPAVRPSSDVVVRNMENLVPPPPPPPSKDDAASDSASWIKSEHIPHKYRSTAEASSGAPVGKFLWARPGFNYYYYRAVRGHTAGSERPNELSLARDEDVVILDNCTQQPGGGSSSSWWDVRTADGSVGVVPSSCFERPGPWVFKGLVLCERPVLGAFAPDGSPVWLKKGDLVDILGVQGPQWRIRTADDFVGMVDSIESVDPEDREYEDLETRQTLSFSFYLVKGRNGRLIGIVPSIYLQQPENCQFQAKARHAFAWAIPELDPKHWHEQISVHKGEVVDILGVQDHWWQIRKADGSVGIVPFTKHSVRWESGKKLRMKDLIFDTPFLVTRRSEWSSIGMDSSVFGASQDTNTGMISPTMMLNPRDFDPKKELITLEDGKLVYVLGPRTSTIPKRNKRGGA